MLNIDKSNQFGIMWDIYDKPNSQFVYGPVALIIGKEQEIAPRYIDTTTTLQVVFSNMKGSFINPYYSSGSTGIDLGEIEIDYDKLDHGEVPNILEIELTELGNMRGKYLGGVILNLGFSGNTERLFYSTNNGKQYNELRLPKGTVENVIMSLPDLDELEELRKDGNAARVTKVIG